MTSLIFASSSVLFFFYVAAPSSFGPPPLPLPTLPPPPALHCGQRLEIAGARPIPGREDGADEEAIWIRNLEPLDVDLTGFSLEVKRRKKKLDGTVIAAGEKREFPSPPLNNKGGEVRLRDPCGIVSSELAWDWPEAGAIYAPPLEEFEL
jgi:hypothetical protein